MTELIVLQKKTLKNEEIEKVVRENITIEIMNNEDNLDERELIESIVYEMKLKYCFRANIKTSKGDLDWDLDKSIWNYCDMDVCSGKTILKEESKIIGNTIIIPIFPKKTMDWFLDFWGYEKKEKNRCINYYELDYEIVLNPFIISKKGIKNTDYKIKFN